MAATSWLRVGRITLLARRPRVRKLGKSLRLRVISGELAGHEGWCMELDRFENPSPNTLIPFDLDSGRHVHLKFEEIEVMER